MILMIMKITMIIMRISITKYDWSCYDRQFCDSYYDCIYQN